jgi:hypothetical protein
VISDPHLGRCSVGDFGREVKEKSPLTRYSLHKVHYCKMKQHVPLVGSDSSKLSTPSLKYNMIRNIEGMREKNAYLHFKNPETLILIGPISSLKYKLIQSLFSPSSAPQTQFNPVQQSTERTYNNMMGNSSSKYDISWNKDDRINAVVAVVISDIQQSELGNYLAFSHTKQYTLMSVK